jgi:hypothetical protein
VSCIRYISAQSRKGIALDCIKDAEPLKVLGENFVKPGKGLGQSGFIKEILWGAETARTFQKDLSFIE